MLTRRLFANCAICAAVGLVATGAEAQQTPAAPMAGLKRTVIKKTEIPGNTHYTLLMTVEIDPGIKVPRHTHPGVESTYVVDGEATLFVQNEADRPIKGGDGFQIAPETPHGVEVGGQKLKLAITYVVEKDKPLVTLAPK